jgi:Cu+-exporting ATPase
LEEGELTMTSATAVKDHVCGMDIDSATAAGKSEYNGQTFYFCGPMCKEKFDAKPEQFVHKSASTAKSGHCGCGSKH